MGDAETRPEATGSDDAPHNSGFVMSRRKFAVAAAWATPVVILASPTPALALSVCHDISMPTNWTWSIQNGTLRTTSFTGFSGNRFISRREPVTGSGLGRVAATTNVATTAGVTYTLNFSTQFAWGNPDMASSCGAILDVIVGGTNLVRLQTRSGMVGGGTLMGTVGAVTNWTYTFVAVGLSTNINFRVTYPDAPTSDAVGCDDVDVISPELLC